MHRSMGNYSVLGIGQVTRCRECAGHRDAITTEAYHRRHASQNSESFALAFKIRNRSTLLMVLQLNDNEKATFLKDEWLFLQNTYEDFDRRSLTIKGWVGGASIAGLSISFGTTIKYAIFIPMIVAIMSLVFWYLESYWKLFQYAFADRIRIIEAYFRSDEDILVKNPEPFQAYNWWYRTYSNDKPIYSYELARRPKTRRQRVIRSAFQRFVCLPYLIIIILSTICAIFLV